MKTSHLCLSYWRRQLHSWHSWHSWHSCISNSIACRMSGHRLGRACVLRDAGACPYPDFTFWSGSIGKPLGKAGNAVVWVIHIHSLQWPASAWDSCCNLLPIVQWSQVGLFGLCYQLQGPKNWNCFVASARCELSWSWKIASVSCPWQRWELNLLPCIALKMIRGMSVVQRLMRRHVHGEPLRYMCSPIPSRFVAGLLGLLCSDFPPPKSRAPTLAFAIRCYKLRSCVESRGREEQANWPQAAVLSVGQFISLGRL